MGWVTRMTARTLGYSRLSSSRDRRNSVWLLYGESPPIRGDIALRGVRVAAGEYRPDEADTDRLNVENAVGAALSCLRNSRTAMFF